MPVTFGAAYTPQLATYHLRAVPLDLAGLKPSTIPSILSLTLNINGISEYNVYTLEGASKGCLSPDFQDIIAAST